eukprot:TRINITY_DN10657_c1_g1_i2.p1 TRINITY_DN10657_c1_g1~~TRINITY_DN10657_c1_g1_i2.p1  ORF type:complete len:393 (+),score=67.83 TRINITY_DN10657_c1_g1_i2:210-1388(+)
MSAEEAKPEVDKRLEQAKEAGEAAAKATQEAAQKTKEAAEAAVQATKDAVKDARDGWGEYNVPDGSFGKGTKAQEKLEGARSCLFCLYWLFGTLLFFSLITFVIGWFEASATTAYFPQLEAPSVAICPWRASTNILENSRSNYDIFVVKVTADGSKILPNKAMTCEYDRVCKCINLYDVKLADVEAPHTGDTGTKSQRSVNFREHIFIQTTLQDPSIASTLKVGLYNSEDHRPTWLYVPQYHTTLGSVRLDSIKLGTSFWNLLTGTTRYWQHHYRFSGNEADTTADRDKDGQPFTKISLEYDSFYVVQTNTSRASSSLYGLVIIALLSVSFLNTHGIWSSFFPVLNDKSGERGVAKPMLWWFRNVYGTDLEADVDTEAALGGRQGPNYGSAK